MYWGGYCVLWKWVFHLLWLHSQSMSSLYFSIHLLTSYLFNKLLYLTIYEGLQRHSEAQLPSCVNICAQWQTQQTTEDNAMWSSLQWHLLRPIAVITLETSRHAVFTLEPSDRNTPHPLDTVDVAMIMTSFEIKFPVLLYCASYKSCHPAGIHCKWGFFHLAWYSVDSNVLSPQVL